MKSNTIAVFTTTDSLEEARELTKTLVEQKLAACAQISEIESFYTWENGVQNDQEFRIMVKTTKDKYKDVEKAILKIHSYDLPAIYAVDVDELYQPYGDWVNESIK
ncbi:MAG: divalent-cation tolerance protein CutA [Candidatus Neomarinimicrobiota bacterium]|nr:divalent-cation tolerance protein CutA [Candidatus Neomarinimicrobiota bacterium]